MTKRSPKRGFAARLGDAESWARTPEPAICGLPTAEFMARLTIDTAPALRGRITIAAFPWGLIIADMLRALLDREYPDDRGAAS